MDQVVQKSPGTKLFNLASWIIVGIMMASVLIFGFWMLFPYKTVSFKSADTTSIIPVHKVENKVVKSGDVLVYDVEYCKYTNITPQITKTFVDGLVYQIPVIVSQITSVGCGTNRIQVDIPKSLPLGEYVIKVTWVYHVNPIRDITILTKTEKFTIIK